MVRKEQQIESMSTEAVLNELKERHLPTFGTAQERKDRLKKVHGISVRTKAGNESGYTRKVTTTDKID